MRHSTPLNAADVLNVLPGMFWDHDCVMLPRLGGFVCNPKSAYYDESKLQMVPPSRDVLFNPRLTTNDGLVANELMAKKGVTYREALRAVELLVDQIQSDLSDGKSFELPGMGKLYKEQDEALRFVTDAEFERMLRSFGHASIPLMALGSARLAAQGETAPTPALEGAQVEQPTSPVTKTPVIPMRVKLGRAAAAVAIPLTLAGAYLLSSPAGTDTLLGSNPLWNASPTVATYAPSVPSEDVVRWSEKVPSQQGETAQAFVERTDWSGTLEFDLDAGKPAAGGLKISVPERMHSEMPEEERFLMNHASDADWAFVEVPQGIHFKIVGGSFSMRENAERLATTLMQQGYATSLHYQAHNGLTAVVLGEFVWETDARRALEDIRNQGFEKAWLKCL